MNKKDIKSKDKKKTLVEKAQMLKDRVIANANAFADRLLNNAIAKETQEKEWQEKKAQIKAEADKKRKELAIAKREAKATQKLAMNKTIPTEISDKDKVAQKRAIVGMDKARKHMADKDEAKANRTPTRLKLTKEERQARAQIRATRVFKAKTELSQKMEEAHTTKEQRTEARKKVLVFATQKFKDEVKRQQSEKAADPKAAAERKTKRIKNEQTRIEMLIKKRVERLEKKQAVELSQKQKTVKIMEQFKIAQVARNEKKSQKRAMYLTKGGSKIPKVKNKAEVRPIVPTTAKKEDLAYRYILRTQYLEEYLTTGDRVGTITCLPSKLNEIVKYGFNKEMGRKGSDKLVGYFVYDSRDPEVCILEMVNSNFREINGVTTTRMNSEAIAA